MVGSHVVRTALCASLRAVAPERGARLHLSRPRRAPWGLPRVVRSDVARAGRLLFAPSGGNSWAAGAAERACGAGASSSDSDGGWR